MATKKKCNRCGELKPRTEFHRHVRMKDGLHGSCKQCHYKSTRVSAKNWRENNPERQRQNQRNNVRRKLYGVSPEQFARMFKEQDGLCAVCGRLMREGGAGPGGPLGRDKCCVDHCHETGKVRGLVHGACNIILGLAGDDPAVLERAAAYLRRAK